MAVVLVCIHALADALVVVLVDALVVVLVDALIDALADALVVVPVHDQCDPVGPLPQDELMNTDNRYRNTHHYKDICSHLAHCNNRHFHRKYFGQNIRQYRRNLFCLHCWNKCRRCIHFCRCTVM